MNALDYLPEPDIFHDVAGHVPMHTDKAFAEALVRFGECAHTAVEIVSEIRNEEERVHRLTNIVKAMARFFWFRDRVRPDAVTPRRVASVRQRPTPVHLAR